MQGEGEREREWWQRPVIIEGEAVEVPGFFAVSSRKACTLSRLSRCMLDKPELRESGGKSLRDCETLVRSASFASGSLSSMKKKKVRPVVRKSFPSLSLGSTRPCSCVSRAAASSAGVGDITRCIIPFVIRSYRMVRVRGNG